MGYPLAFYVKMRIPPSNARLVRRGGFLLLLLPPPPPRGTHFLYFCFQIILADNQPAILGYPMPRSLHRLLQPAIPKGSLKKKKKKKKSGTNISPASALI